MAGSHDDPRENCLYVFKRFGGQMIVAAGPFDPTGTEGC